MAAGARHLDGLLRVQAAGRGQHHAIGIAVLEQRGQRGVAASAGLVLRGLQRLRVVVADVHQVGALGMARDGFEVALRNAPAADEGKSHFAVGDGGSDGGHEGELPQSCNASGRDYRSAFSALALH